MAETHQCFTFGLIKKIKSELCGCSARVLQYEQRGRPTCPTTASNVCSRSYITEVGQKFHSKHSCW